MPAARFVLTFMGSALHKRFAVGIVSLGMLGAACGDVSSTPPEPAHVGSLSSAMRVSAEKAAVPRDLLLAIAKVEDGLTLPAERIAIDVDNEVPAAGPLQLRRGKLDTLARGAALTHRSEVELRLHSDLALEAGALVLAELGAKTGARHDDLASFREAVAEMSGFLDDAHREHYVHRVFAMLARGGTFEARDGETIELTAHPELPPSLTIDVSAKLHILADTPQFAGAEWIPTSCTNKCVVGRGGVNIDTIVIHDTEGGWEASVATLQNDSGKSVQYIVGTDGRVGQFVTEETTAWHAGNSTYNKRSVGIEHVGYANKPFTEAEYAASAKLVDYLATKYNVARDRAHIIGHDQVPNGNKIDAASPPCSTSPKACESSSSYGGANNHGDPGIWEWAPYMARINGAAKCNDVSTVLTCSNDKTKAFRCVTATDKVDVLTCTSACVDGAAKDQDATCNVAPASAPPAAPAPTKNEPPSGFLPPTSSDAPAEDSGCAVSSGSNSHSGHAYSGIFALCLAVATVCRMRKRRGN